ncbi:hypothetical protein [Lentzea flava]|uniref:Uncharacterized protein n=1 Tax=Lentzea flava TaxID=103732 RepID=A0ABQ2VEV8_9PSEU|nr:hypothetical protein [Lentzea flava]MCP2205055.1 hypothetical protein [Lentzea flava]GGU83491.1 hypothetical protein GCM10010178_87340 [Lentzea flava]
MTAEPDGVRHRNRYGSPPRNSACCGPFDGAEFADNYGGPMWNVQLAAATMTALAHTGVKG